MLLVDTSIWIDHFRQENTRLSARLVSRDVLIHPFVIGELALGYVPHFNEIVQDLMDLPDTTVATPAEVLRLISKEALAGSCIGYVDAHLVASTLLTSGARLWTRDKKLRAVAERLAISAPDLP